MNFIKAGTSYYNLDTVTQFDVVDRYNFETEKSEPAVHIHFTSGGTGENSTSVILYGKDRHEFLAKIAALEIGVSQKSTDEQTADALMRIADAIGDRDDETLVPDSKSGTGSLIQNLDFIAVMLSRVADKLGWLKSLRIGA